MTQFLCVRRYCPARVPPDPRVEGLLSDLAEDFGDLPGRDALDGHHRGLVQTRLCSIGRHVVYRGPCAAPPRKH